MFRYIAFLWNTSCESEQHVQNQIADRLLLSADWSICFSAPGVCVLESGSRGPLKATRLPREAGIVLGRAFPIEGQSTSLLGANSVDRIVTSFGKYLIESFWGRYVAFVQDLEQKRLLITRDASGSMRCFLTRVGGVLVVTSNVEDLANLRVKFTPNWSYISAELTGQAATGWHQTGLTEVSCLSAGETIEVIRGQVVGHSQHWDPVAVAKGSMLTDYRLAAEQLKHVVRYCVREWADVCGGNIALTLSGGLDSSIILSCLRDLAQIRGVSGLTLYHEKIFGDERDFARAAAAHAGIELSERRRPTNVNLECLYDLPSTARPSGNTLDYVLFWPIATSFARERDATAIFVGEMGDNLFCQKLCRYAAIDTVWMHGLGRRAAKVAFDVAQATGRSSVWTESMRAAWYGSASRFADLRAGLIRADTENELFHPRLTSKSEYRFRQRWLKSISDVPIGKLFHILAISNGQGFFDPIGVSGDPEWIMPLYSQPIIDLCLRIPLELFVYGGWDRSVVRQAFHADLPPSVATRRMKGTTVAQRNDIYHANRAFVQSTLASGELVRRQLLNASAIEAADSAFGADADIRGYCSAVLMRSLWIETWLRNWNARSLGASLTSEPVVVPASNARDATASNNTSPCITWSA